MTTISHYLKAEMIDPSIPRDSFVPPDDEDEDEYEDEGEDDLGDLLSDLPDNEEYTDE